MKKKYDQIAENILQSASEQLVKELNQIVRPSKEEVRRRAKDFISKYRLYEQLYKKELNTLGKTSSKKLSSQLQLKIVRKSFYDFQNSINLYFGQILKVMYVYMDPNNQGQVTLSVLENDIQHLEENKWGTVSYHLNELKNIFKLEDYNSFSLDNTQQNIYNRWQIAKQKAKRSTWLPILWNIENKWHGAFVNNLGSIGEAYVKFYINKHQFVGGLEENIGVFILNPDYGVQSVDNASGFLIGDTSMAEGAIQLAVKKEYASPENLKQIYDIVSLVIYEEDFIEILKNRFIEQEKESAKHSQVKKLSEQLENSNNKLLKSLVQSYLTNKKNFGIIK